MKKAAKNLVGLLAVLAFAIMAGCTTANEWAYQKMARDVKTEIRQVDEAALIEAINLPKKVAVADVTKAPDADPALSDETLAKMKAAIIEEFTKFVKAGWSVDEQSPIKLYVIMSSCNGGHLKGSAIFKKEDKVIAEFYLQLERETKMQLKFTYSNAYMTDYELRRLFAHGIIKAINGLSQDVEEK